MREYTATPIQSNSEISPHAQKESRKNSRVVVATASENFF